MCLKDDRARNPLLMQQPCRRHDGTKTEIRVNPRFQGVQGLLVGMRSTNVWIPLGLKQLPRSVW